MLPFVYCAISSGARAGELLSLEWKESTAPAEPRPTETIGSGKTYVVVKGDSLSKIAKREYGDANKWRAIYEANKDIIKDPDLIYPGQELKVPGA